VTVPMFSGWLPSWWATAPKASSGRSASTLISGTRWGIPCRDARRRGGRDSASGPCRRASVSPTYSEPWTCPNPKFLPPLIFRRQKAQKVYGCRTR